MKEWPRDAVIVVCSSKGKERRERMTQPVERTCRDCGKALVADLLTLAAAEKLPSRHNRPIDFLCIDCALKHKPPTEVHNFGKP